MYLLVGSENNDEILISGATVANVEIITAITAERLKSDGAVVTSVSSSGEVVQSSAETITSTTGGSTY